MWPPTAPAGPGRDAHSMWTAFGPTNVAVHHVSQRCSSATSKQRSTSRRTSTPPPRRRRAVCGTPSGLPGAYTWASQTKLGGAEGPPDDLPHAQRKNLCRELVADLRCIEGALQRNADASLSRLPRMEQA